MNKRFYLEKLVVTGNGLKSASLEFSQGANLIVGSSNTGKSYIFQCINYLLGGGDCPKDIPQSKGYTEAYLEIKSNENVSYTICRSLKNASTKGYVTKSTFEKYATSPKNTLGLKNSTADGENISEFLLNLMGVKDISLKTNAEDKTRKLSFRDIAHLTLIDEQKITTDGSPVYSSMNNYSRFTVEKSAFKYLLTGSSDNDLIEKEEKKVFESKIKGKLEFIGELLTAKNETVEKLQSLRLDLTAEEINEKINRLLELLESSTKKIDELTLKRENDFKELQQLRSQNLQNNELLKRFYLLKVHYKNDLDRLNFILEGEYLFKQLITTDCPVCGTIMDENHLKCFVDNIENKEIGTSIKIERKKIELKLIDLEATILSTETITNENDTLIDEKQKKFNSLVEELNNVLLPLRKNFQSQVTQLINYTTIEKDIDSAKKDIESLFGDRSKLQKELQSKTKKEVAKVDLDYSILQLFCKYVEKLLTSWRFPGLTSVEFNDKHSIFDLIISLSGRNIHGKGVRALSYSAFTFGLLDYCISESKPHSGFIVIDSPLTTYHNNQPRENGDEIDPDMQVSFFENLAKVTNDRQVIILDNKIPPSDIISKINYIKFSNEPNSIRRGFFITTHE